MENYHFNVHLGEPYNPPKPAPVKEKTRAVLVDDLVKFLRPEEIGGPGVQIPASSPYPESRGLLRALLTRRGPQPLPIWFHEKLDRLLQRETLDRGVVEVAALPHIVEAIPATTYGAAPNCALWRGDITTLRVDAVVNAANADLLGCFIPFHACIDNVIHSAAGPRLREDCHTIMEMQGHPEDTGRAKITRAYNLPAKYVLHTVGPVVEGGRGVSPDHEQKLSASYRSCLDLARRVKGIRSIAFCCISTGVFGFPQEPAARIALRTVERWLADHPDHLELIILNVFQQNDYEIYEGLLNRLWSQH